ncbi:hypothetical protein AMELA_G00120040 [Ameiurus melas]|uniref:E3 ubiquitin-protein ligase TRIM39-like n=1 Tax=Ameiurus melas TaxID=219545 RepID=A0A7J6ALI5_AMEME|nr:hypothetical protein AMELA_G00120040 [Ameiurus melas]
MDEYSSPQAKKARRSTSDRSTDFAGESSSLLTEEQLQCSICLEVFTDPVTTPCGHSFCNSCLTQSWDTSQYYYCPFCKEKFAKRPQIKINITLKKNADRIKKKTVSDKSQVLCDFCTGVKQKALKSCLDCGVAFCLSHLDLHNNIVKNKKHKVINAVENLEKYICQQHERNLEMFCRDDQKCVCRICTVTDHKNHNVIPLEEESGERKTCLGGKRTELQQMIQERLKKIEEINHSAELSKRNTKKEKSDSIEVFTTLIRSIERSQAELLEVMEEKQKAAEKQAEGLIKKLQKEISVLRRRDTELEQLSHTDDHLNLLQIYPSLCIAPHTKNWTEIRINTELSVLDVKTTVTRLQQTLNEKLSRMLNEKLKEMVPTELKRIQQYAGRFYYEVQVSRKTMWSLGVVKESVNRKEEVTLTPQDGFWTMALRKGNEYKACDDNHISLSLREKPQKVGVFVDYDEGLVSFYDVDARSHIYSFTGQSFTEKLYPYFCPSNNDEEFSYCGSSGSEKRINRTSFDKEKSKGLKRRRKEDMADSLSSQLRQGRWNNMDTPTEFADHKNHNVIPLEEESGERKSQLGKTQKELQQMIQERLKKIQEINHSVELSKRNTEKEKSDSMEVFTALIRSIERSQAELLEVTEKKQKAEEKQAEGLIKEIQQEIDELKRRDTELEQLSHTDDHLHLLQIYPSLCIAPHTKNWTEIRINTELSVEALRTTLFQLQKTLNEKLSVTLNKKLKEKVSTELKRIQQYAVDVTLDPDTANPHLILSDDGKQVTNGDAWQDLPDTPKRFTYHAIILGKQSFSSGRFYYEVQVSRKTMWSLGVVRESVNRKGKIALTPQDGFWTMILRKGNEYKACDDPCISLSLREKPQKVGVFVDYDEGLVSFYDVEARSHIYSFTGQSFTEKLYPYFSPCFNDGGKNAAPLIISRV